jgi:hypothetical protein
MRFIDNFKYNYQKKYFLSVLNEKNETDLQKLIIHYLQTKNPLYYSLLSENIDSIQNIFENSNNITPNIIWLNSFDNLTNNILEKFLVYYFLHSSEQINYSFNSYVNEVVEKLSVFKKSLNITFADFVFNSDFYQLLISFEKKNKIIFLKNNMAFFEHQSGKKFTYKNFTNSYFYTLQNPKNLYLTLKNDNEKNDDGQSIFNLDQQPLQRVVNHNGYEHRVEVNRSSWKNNVSSWDNENVKNTHRGLILKLEDLVADPVYHFAVVLSHLNQSNIDVEIDYNLIQKYVLDNPLQEINAPGDLSNKELKVFNRELSKKAKEHGYL